MLYINYTSIKKKVFTSTTTSCPRRPCSASLNTRCWGCSLQSGLLAHRAVPGHLHSSQDRASTRGVCRVKPADCRALAPPKDLWAETFCKMRSWTPDATPQHSLRMCTCPAGPHSPLSPWDPLKWPPTRAHVFLCIAPNSEILLSFDNAWTRQRKGQTEVWFLGTHHCVPYWTGVGWGGEGRCRVTKGPYGSISPWASMTDSSLLGLLLISGFPVTFPKGNWVLPQVKCRYDFNKNHWVPRTPTPNKPKRNISVGVYTLQGQV